LLFFSRIVQALNFFIVFSEVGMLLTIANFFSDGAAVFLWRGNTILSGCFPIQVREQTPVPVLTPSCFTGSLEPSRKSSTGPFFLEREPIFFSHSHPQALKWGALTLLFFFFILTNGFVTPQLRSGLRILISGFVRSRKNPLLLT